MDGDPQTAINYRNGWFFVTSQVAHDNSIFGAIVDERCEMNAFGREVEKCWRELPIGFLMAVSNLATC